MPSPDQNPKPFTARIKEFFGFKPGQTMTEFAAELKALTPTDRAELTDLLNKAGYPVATPAPAPA